MSNSTVRATSRDAVLIVGFGDIGARVARALSPTHRVIALVRNKDGESHARSCGAEPLFGDLDHVTSLLPLASMASTVFHFAPPPDRGRIDTRTANLIAALGGAATRRQCIYISTTGVYGDCQGWWVDESTPVNPQSERATRRHDAEAALTGWASAARVALVILRSPGIYAENRLPLARLRAGTPAIIAAEDAWSNHIHADDLAGAALAAMSRSLVGENTQGCATVFNIVDDRPLKMGDYFDLVADHFGMARPPRISRHEAEMQMSRASLSFMRESRRLRNDRMKKDLGLSLQHPTVEEFLTGLNRPSHVPHAPSS